MKIFGKILVLVSVILIFGCENGLKVKANEPSVNIDVKKTVIKQGEKFDADIVTDNNIDRQNVAQKVEIAVFSLKQELFASSSSNDTIDEEIGYIVIDGEKKIITYS